MQIPSNLPSIASRSILAEGTASREMTMRRSSDVLVQKLRYQQPMPPRRSVATVAKIAAEPDDATITGTTRSLSRRLLALNIRHDA